MSNSVYPTLPGISWGASKTPMWSTGIQKSVSGREVRLANYTYPLYRITLTYEFLRSAATHAEFQTLIGFFNSRQGSYDSFLFTDPEDNSVVAQNFGVGNGATTGFQLVRSLGGNLEPVMNLNGAPQIYKNGVLQTLTTHYTIDSYGYVVFTSPPAAGQALTWTGGYYYRCRFAEDEAEFENFLHLLWKLSMVEFIGCLGAKI